MQRLQRIITVAVVMLAGTAVAPLAHAARTTKVSLSGRVQMSHTDGFTQRKAGYERFMQIGKRRYRLNGKRAAGLAPGSKVKLSGSKTGSEITVDDATTLENRNPVVSSSSRQLRAVHKRIAIIPFRYQSDPALPTSGEMVSRLFGSSGSAKSLTNFIEEISGGELGVDTAMLGPYTVNQSRPSGCNWEGQFVPAARALADTPGNSLFSYDYLIYMAPAAGGCGNMAGATKWGGPGAFSYINGIPADPASATRVLAHELGHQMYLHHASGYRCDPGQPIQPEGSACRDEYGDPFDAMGNSMAGANFLPPRQFSGFHKAQLGSRNLIPKPKVQEVNESGTFNLAPSNVAPGAKPTTLMIPRPTGSLESRYYYVELRASTGAFDDFDCAPPNVCSSLQIRIGPSYFGGPLTQSLLVDTTPQTPGNYLDAPLASGRTFSDPANGLVLTNQGLNADGSAKVAVDVTDKLPPSAPTKVKARSSSPGLKVSWSRSFDFAGNQASAATSPIAGYDVYRDGVKVMSTASLSILDVPTPGQHTYTVRGRDLVGNVSPMSAAGSATMRGSTANTPDVTITDPDDGSTPGASVVVDASANGVGSPIRSMTMLVDGRKIGSSSGSNLTRSWDPRPSSVAKGAHAIVISATDYNGNTGSDSVTLNKQ